MIRFMSFYLLILTWLGVVYAQKSQVDLCQDGGLWGSALSLHEDLPEFGLNDQKQIDRMVEQGFRSISLVVHWHQEHVSSHGIHAAGLEHTSDQRLIKAIHYAHQKKLVVMLLPIIWLKQRAKGQWRGTLHPTHPTLWWKAYTRFIMHYATIAQKHKVAWLSIGSELSSMEKEWMAWRQLIKKIRMTYQGKLIYSANWDHYQNVPFWHLLDAMGMTAYYEIATYEGATVQHMLDRWHLVRSALHEWYASKQYQIPLLFTEIGYASQKGSATQPWHYTRSTLVDLKEQFRAYQAFALTWYKDPLLCTAFFWNSWGIGGLQDTWYTLSGKPALMMIQAFMQARKRSMQSY